MIEWQAFSAGNQVWSQRICGVPHDRTLTVGKANEPEDKKPADIFHERTLFSVEDQIKGS